MPTLREVEESNWDKNPFTNHMDGEFRIRLWKRGTFIIKDAGWDIERQFTCMTSDQKGDEVICYGCYRGQGYFKIFPDSKQSKYFVFLVKNK